MQPTWIPSNLRFEVDDATLPWTYDENFFDFVHIRYLSGTIADWTALFKEAHRTLTGGGWVQDCQIDPRFRSDDGTTDEVEAMQRWSRLFEESGVKTGASFTAVADGLQRKSLEEAGFEDVQTKTFKVRRALRPTQALRSNSFPHPPDIKFIETDDNRSPWEGGLWTPNSPRLVASYMPRWRMIWRATR